MDEGEVNVSQQATQPLNESFQYVDPSQSQRRTQSQHSYWGRLYPLKMNLQPCDLVENRITVGKGSSCHLKLTMKEIPVDLYPCVSNVHFEIRRAQAPRGRTINPQTSLINRSTNGTFLNGSCLKDDEPALLSSNDVIGLTFRSGCQYEAYVFVNVFESIPSIISYSVRQKYQVSKRIGRGTFGEVYLVFDKETCRPLAMKTIVQDASTNSHQTGLRKKLLHNELVILQSLNHPHVVKLIPDPNESVLFLEYMEGNDLDSHRRKSKILDESIARLFFYQIASGINYLHRNDIVHRDLKPANILLSSSNMDTLTLLKISDFGLSKILSPDTILKTMCGSKMYAAPEVLTGRGGLEYTAQVDIWSLGAILYFCLTGSDPFSTDLLDHNIIWGIFEIKTKQWRTLSTRAKALITGMLNRKPKERLTISHILEDSWLKDKALQADLSKLYASHGIQCSPIELCNQ